MKRSAIDMDRSAELRRNTIVERVNDRGYMTIEDLGALLGVSQATLRSDLDELDKTGKLVRLRGVAISMRYAGGDPERLGDSSALMLSSRLSEEKRVIARLCAGELEKDSTVFVDTSNTNLYVAEELVRLEKRLTVVTNSLDIVGVLRHSAQIDAILVGGDFEAGTNSIVGSHAVQFLSNFYAHTAIVTARGLDARGGVGVYHARNTDVRRAMLARAATRIIVADHSKFTQPGVEHLCDWKDVDVLATDQAPPEAYREALARAGVRILIPQEGES